MNVSSVKNLNGEVFSAVQDASLTDTVRTNSGNWQDITAYQNASATYLTAVDLTTYATTAEVDSISSMLSGAIDYVSANAGDEFPASANDAITAYQTNSATYLTAHQAISAEEWNDCYDNVNTNSGVWGGNALPISAGPGIKFEMVNDTLVASTDETVLWSGNAAAASFPLTLSEPISGFESVKFVWIPRYQGDYGSPTQCDTQETQGYGGTVKYTLMAPYWNASSPWLGWWYLGTTDDQSELISVKNAFGNPYATTALTDGLACRMIKVIGINRIAGGN